MARGFLQRSRHGTRLYFRRRVPGDLVDCVGKRQLYRALGTSDLGIARIVARALAAWTDALFEQVRTMTKQGKKPDEIRAQVDELWNSWGTPASPQNRRDGSTTGEMTPESEPNGGSASPADERASEDGVRVGFTL